jgi:ribonucleotide reductase beta subunit family protein with ferritin-like domain
MGLKQGGATHNVPHLPNISLPLLLLKASSFLAPYVPSFGLSNGVLLGLCFANELISHDEALHCDFACGLYNCLLKPPHSIHVREIIDSAIQIEECFICKALPFNLMGMSATLMNQHIFNSVLIASSAT